MAKDNNSQTTTGIGQMKWALILAAVLLLLVAGMVVFTIFGGMELADPWGKQPGPGP